MLKDSNKLAVIVLLSIGLFLAVADFFLNDYQRFWVVADTKLDNQPEKYIQVNPQWQKIKEQLPPEVQIKDPIIASVLFSRLSISELKLERAIQTSLTKDIRKFATIYEMSGGEATYFKIRTGLELILQPDDTIFDANNLGDYSLYYNDKQRPDTIFLLTLINNTIWGFEYDRTNHELFKKITKTLVVK